MNQPNPPASNSRPASQPVSVSQLFLWLAWIVYVGYLLLSDFPPGPSLLHTEPATLKEALDLSFNFWFVMPLVFPNLAPSLSPALEGLFNLTVAWGLLFWGFAIDGRGQRFPLLPFLIGTAFLTNVFYLPWLALRRSQQSLPPGPLSPIETVSESRWLPGCLAAVAIAALGWAGFGRPEFGDFATRWADFQMAVGSDRLAYSFVIDLVTFWIFQGWLVADDMTRRNWSNRAIAWVARLVPFLGLVIYLWIRPPLDLEREMPAANQ
ncbi:MAG: hypothetical protein AB4040_15640 [Synechococcus sp.]